MPNLTQAQSVMKALIEGTLRRELRPINPIDIRTMLEAMAIIINDPVIHVFADAHRFAEDFASVMHRKCQYIGNLDYARSLRDCSVVILLTGMRTANQQARYDEFLNILAHRQDIIRWRIGEWR